MKRLLALAAVTLFASSVGRAADAPKPSAADQAMMEKMMKAATPGPQHAVLTKQYFQLIRKSRFLDLQGE